MSRIEAKAEMNGTIIEIIAQVGDVVEDGDPLLMMESMKMEIPVSVARKGVVSAIGVTVGQAVAEGDVLAVIEA